MDHTHAPDADPPRAGRGSVGEADVIATAMAIADRDGLAALTIRRLAAELGLGAMTVYGHVRTKDELIERVVEAAISTLEIPPVDSGPWDGRLEQLFTKLHVLLWEHPCVLYADVQQPLIGPAALRCADAALEILRTGGLTPVEAVRGMNLLLSYTFGAAMFRLNQAGAGRAGYERQIRTADPATLPRIVEHSAALLSRGGAAEFGPGLRLIITGLSAAEKRDR